MEGTNTLELKVVTVDCFEPLVVKLEKSAGASLGLPEVSRSGAAVELMVAAVFSSSSLRR